MTQLIKAYGEQASVKELAQSFGIHRVTVTARFDGTEWSCASLAANLRRSRRPPVCTAGWSLARLGEKFGVDPATVSRALRKASDL